MMYKAIAFDFFGVFCTSMASNWFQKNVPDHQEKLVAYQALLTQGDLGKLPRADFDQAVSELTGFAPDQVARGIDAEKAIDTDLVVYVQGLKKQGYRIVCLSNGSHEWTLRVINDHAMGHLFEDVILSGDLGIVKPDAEIYEYMLVKLKLPASEVLFVDDRQVNVDGAEACGIDGLLFSDTPTFIRDFEALTQNTFRK